jgi:predicted DsbA family dithiol-disulfide isomerase
LFSKRACCLTIISQGHVGQKRLEKAIHSYTNTGNATITNKPVIYVDWRPYIIDPGTNPSGETFEAYTHRRWGSSSWTNRLKQEGSKDGASFQNWKWWPNTTNAHCLIKFAQEKYGVESSKSNAALFKALYEEGKNISLIDVLVQIGMDDLGLPEEELKNYIESDEGVAGVQNQIKDGKQKYQISGVPFFMIGKEGSDDEPYGLSGAQKPQTFINLFEELSEE